MSPPRIVYSKDMDRARVWKKLTWPDPRLSLSNDDFIKEVVMMNHKTLPALFDPRAWTEIDDGFLEFTVREDAWTAAKFQAEVLFYFLSQMLRHRPGLFPVPDITLAVFNILSIRHELLKCRLLCLDLSLLPVAALAAAWGASIALPLAYKNEKWPRALFHSYLSLNKNCEGTIVIGSDPFKLIEDRPSLLNQLSSSKGGIIFCYWDFLGVNLYSYPRQKWLEAGIVRSLVQLPMPRRQSSRTYPALIEICPSRPDVSETLIRLADVREKPSAVGPLSQSAVLHAVFSPPEKGTSLDIAPDLLAVKENGDFTPRRFLAAAEKAGEIKLGDCAQLIRCHLARARHDPEEREGDGLVCREISLSHLDLAGFAMPGTGNLVRVHELNPQGPEGKFLLRKNDILICFRGTEATIGRVGLVADEPEEPTISGQSICLVRVRDADPIWLYHYLRQNQVRRRILGRCSGKSMLTANLGDLRDFSVIKPSPKQIKTVTEKHESLLVAMKKVRQILDGANEDLEDLDALFS